MDLTEHLPDEAALRAWDWRAELRRQGRTIPWLARETGRPQNSIYTWAYSGGRAPLEWLRQAAKILGRAE